MNLKEILLKRRSVRSYTDQAVSSADIEELLHAAMSGPSACNKQPWLFYVVTNEEVLEKLRGVKPKKLIKAPLDIIVAGDKNKFLETAPEYWVQDVSAATENILLRAVDLGLAAVWCGIYPVQANCEKISEILKLDDNIVPFCMIHVGYAAEDVEPRDQYNQELVKYIK